MMRQRGQLAWEQSGREGTNKVVVEELRKLSFLREGEAALKMLCGFG